MQSKQKPTRVTLLSYYTKNNVGAKSLNLYELRFKETSQNPTTDKFNTYYLSVS